jgi:PAS domain S-box-containing protein
MKFEGAFVLESLTGIAELFQGFPVPVLVLSDEGGRLLIAYANNAFGALCGMEAAGMENMSASLLQRIEGQPDPGPAIMRVMYQGAELEIEAAVPRRGGRLSIRLVGQGMRTVDDQPIFFAIVRDNSEYQKLAQARASSELMLSAVIGNIDLPMLMLSDDGKIVLVNPSLLRLIERSIEEVAGRHFSILIPAEDWPSLSPRFQQGLVSDEESRRALRLLTGRGRAIHVELLARPVRQISGRRLRMVTFASLEDIHPGPRGSLSDLPDVKAANPSRPLIAGRLQLIGLDDVRTALGERWGQVRVQALAIAEGVIRHHLGADDMMERTADDGFVIFFGDLPEAEASQRAKDIAQQVRNRLLGSNTASLEARVESFAAEVELENDAFQGSGVAEVLLAKLAQRREESRQQVSRLLKAALQKATLDPIQVTQPEGYPMPFFIADLAHPWREDIADALLSIADDVNVSFEADLVTLSVAMDWHRPGKRDTTLFMPVRFENLMLPRLLDRYVEVARNLPVELRRQVVFHLVQMPFGTAGSRISGMVQTLGPHCKGIAIELNAVDHVLDPLGTRVSVVSIDYEQLGPMDGTGRARLQKLLRTYHLRKMRVLVTKVPREEDAFRLASDGVDMVTLAR